MHIHRHRLAVIDPGLGADDEGADLGRIDVERLQGLVASSGGHGHGVLAGRGDCHLPLAQAMKVLAGIDASSLGQGGHFQIVLGSGKGEGIDADGCVLHGVPIL